MMKPIRDSVTTLLDPEAAPWGLGKFTGFMRDTLLNLFPVPAKAAAEGGLVGMSSFASNTLGAALGLESGGLFTLSQGEFVLDNQAAQTFLQAAMILKGQDLSSGKNLMDLQRDKAAVGGMAVTTVVNNTNSQQINQSQAMVLPPSPIMAGNGESTLSTA